MGFELMLSGFRVYATSFYHYVVCAAVELVSFTCWVFGSGMTKGDANHIFLFSCCVQFLSRVWVFETTQTAAHQAPLSFAISRSLLKSMSVELEIPSNHLILYCHPFLLLPSIFPSIKVLCSELALHIRWPKHLVLQLQHQSFQWIFRIDFP